jgi:hypothetical protein
MTTVDIASTALTGEGEGQRPLTPDMTDDGSSLVDLELGSDDDEVVMQTTPTHQNVKIKKKGSGVINLNIFNGGTDEERSRMIVEEVHTKNEHHMAHAHGHSTRSHWGCFFLEAFLFLGAFLIVLALTLVVIEGFSTFDKHSIVELQHSSSSTGVGNSSLFIQ